MDSQLLFVIPFVDGYAKERHIDTLIFDRPLSPQLKSHPIIQSILNKYNIVEQRIHQGLTKYIFLIYPAVMLLKPAMELARRTSREGLLDSAPWHESQLRHAVWDQTLQAVSDGTINLPLLKRLKAALLVLMSVKKAQKLIAKHGTVAAVIGHTVYAGRGLLAQLRQNNIDVIAHAGNVFHRTHADKDVSYLSLPRLEWDLLGKVIEKSSVDRYWNGRIGGKSSYSDAELAAKGMRPISNVTPKNVIFLHIFRDSPFNHIDRSRIFSDYTHWIEQTLIILKESKETWLIKTHPSASRWGESQMDWLFSIGRYVFGKNWPKHIKIDENGYSNIDLILNAKRILTYKGTVHLEAACIGIRPIVISDVTLSSYDYESVLKPETLAEYSWLLLCPETSNCFRLDATQIENAKRLLYIREEVLSFARNVRSIPIYRGDPKNIFIAKYDSIAKNLERNVHALATIGKSMANGLPRSVQFDYIDQWEELYMSSKHQSYR